MCSKSIVVATLGFTYTSPTPSTLTAALLITAVPLPAVLSVPSAVTTTVVPPSPDTLSSKTTVAASAVCVVTQLGKFAACI